MLEKEKFFEKFAVEDAFEESELKMGDLTGNIR